jgi:hypothetical protein
LFGLTFVIAGGATYVKRSPVFAALCAVGLPVGPLMTVTSTAPAVPAGDTVLIDVLLLTVKLGASVSPNITPVAPVNCSPVSDTGVPPAVDPVFGLTALTQNESIGRHGGYAEVVGPPVPTIVADMPSVWGSECGTKQVVAASPGPTSVAVVSTIAA